MERMPRIVLAGASGFGYFFVSACATVTTGSSQSVTVETLPDGAKCMITREEQTIGAISQTPGTVSLGKSVKPMDIRCEKEGHDTADQSFDSSFQGATLGNVLLGGVIGVAIDIGTGAANKYPENVYLVLVPHQFATEQEKEKFFLAWRDRVETQTEASINQLKEQVGEEDHTYSGRLEKILMAKSAQLEVINEKQLSVPVLPKAQAVIGEPATAELD